MSEIADTIEAGRLAWDRVRESKRTSFDDWIAIGRALIVGRGAAMKAAGTNRAVGTKYNRLMYRWLLDHGLAEINPQERYRAIKVIENLEEVQLWRDGLPEAQRLRFNHPNCIWQHFSRAFAPGRRVEPRLNDQEASAPKKRRQQIVDSIAKLSRRGKPVFWGQDHLRRAHRAMLDSRSTDLLTLAKLALQAAIRSEDDLLALIDDTPRRLPGDAAEHVAA